METLLTEIRYAVRSLLKHPGFTAIAVVTLALGISANTTIFSAVDSLLLHPFSFPNQDRLVVLFEQNRATGLMRGSVSPGNFVEWRDQNQSYEHLVAIQQRAFDLSDGSTPERIPGYQVTDGFFQADLVTFGAVSISLIVVALIACYLPARRATRVAPLVALRHE